MAGTNDMGQGIAQEQILEDLRELHEICHACGTTTVALAPPPAPGQPSAREKGRHVFIANLEKMCSDMDGMAICVDPAKFVPLHNSSLWESDGLHFSPAGSQALGQGLASLAMQRLHEHGAVASSEPSDEENANSTLFKDFHSQLRSLLKLPKEVTSTPPSSHGIFAVPAFVRSQPYPALLGRLAIPSH